MATMAVRTNNCTRGCVVVLLWANRVEKRAGRCEAGVGAVVPTKRCLYPFVNVGGCDAGFTCRASREREGGGGGGGAKQ